MNRFSRFWAAFVQVKYPERNFGWIIIVALLISFVLKAWSNYLRSPNISSSSDTQQVVSTAVDFLSNCFFAIGTAALTGYFFAVNHVWQQDGRRGRFCQLFGCTLGNLDEEVVIVIPGFPLSNLPVTIKARVKNLEGGENITEEEIKEWIEFVDLSGNASPSVKRLAEVGDLVLANADIQAAKDLIALFSGLELPVPRIYLDSSDRIDSDSTLKGKKAKTKIVVGLFSNEYLIKKCFPEYVISDSDPRGELCLNYRDDTFFKLFSPNRDNIINRGFSIRNIEYRGGINGIMHTHK